MKILHVSSSDSRGGAARAAYRIHNALLGNGAESRMRVLHKESDSPSVAANRTSPLSHELASRLRQRLARQKTRDFRTDSLGHLTFGHESAGLVDELNSSDADILHLHWISGMLSIKDIGRLKKPVVWTLHDMWAFCGAEHYAPDGADARFRTGYLPDSRPRGESGPDLNRMTWLAKRKAWSGQRFTFVSPSQWMESCRQQSALLGGYQGHLIPYPLDATSVWLPAAQDVARSALRLPPDAAIVLMGADGGVRDPRKGGDLLRQALQQVRERLQDRELCAVIFGQGLPDTRDDWPCEVHWLGAVRDDRMLALAYSAADVMVVPSRQEALGQTATESLACGTPVVAFRIGGLADVITHKVSGWLANPFDVADLARGILWVIAQRRRSNTMGVLARSSVIDRYEPARIADLHHAVYANILHNVSADVKPA